MKKISQYIYKEMKQLGLLKERSIKDSRTGKTIGLEKNYQVLNRQKNSRVKSYVVEDSVLQEYLDTIG